MKRSRLYNGTIGLFMACSGIGATPAYSQIDCLGVDGGTALVGTPCNDNNPFTENDLWYPECWCIGVCDSIIGEPCDDSDPNTTSDVLTVCGCQGTCAFEPGTPCDDMNPWTSNDMIWPWGCGCRGSCDWPPGTLCDDGDPLTTGEFLDAQCQCIGGSNLISGQVFLDYDQNGVFDGADLPVQNRTVQIGPYPYRYTATDDQGEFYIVVPSGTYSLTVTPGSFDEQAQAPPTVEVIGEGNISSGHMLAMNATAMEDDLAAHVCGSRAVPGFAYYFTAVSHNHGTLPTTGGTLELTHDPQLTFIATDTSASVNANQVSWDIPPMQPGELVFRRVVLHTPASLPLGTALEQSTGTSAVPLDVVPANDQLTFQQTVVGAFDPNDKQVSPSLLTLEDLAAEVPVTYTVRFQNTGTLAAQNIRITDQLPNGVYHTTFEFIGSSHPCHTMFVNGVLEFRFDNIMLPDSNSNESESHGFVMFSVRPKANLAPGDSVWNRAYIYFDFNEPIVTNAAIFTIDQTTSATTMTAASFSLVPWPNPATNVLNMPIEESLTKDLSIVIVDVHGREVYRRYQGRVSRTIEMPVTGLASGVYTVQLRSGDVIVSYRFVKE